MRQRLKPTTRDARQGIILLIAIVAAMWVLEAVNSIDHNALDNAGGIYPRNFDHLWAIFTSPFLHQNFAPHLLDNTIPLLFMGVIIALRGALRLAAVTLIVIIVGGLGTWVASPSGSITIGASGVVFGYATYLFARGVFNRKPARARRRPRRRGGLGRRTRLQRRASRRHLLAGACLRCGRRSDRSVDARQAARKLSDPRDELRQSRRPAW